MMFLDQAQVCDVVDGLKHGDHRETALEGEHLGADEHP
jgi:hypothetical protein